MAMANQAAVYLYMSMLTFMPLCILTTATNQRIMQKTLKKAYCTYKKTYTYIYVYIYMHIHIVYMDVCVCVCHFEKELRMQRICVCVQIGRQKATQRDEELKVGPCASLYIHTYIHMYHIYYLGIFCLAI